MSIANGITIQQVAERAGVSIATISRVINDSGKVKPETRQRVLAAIDELGFEIKNPRYIHTRNKSIIVSFPDLRNPFSNEVIEGIRSVASNRGYAVFCMEAMDNFLDYEDIMNNHNYAGIILSHNISSTEQLEQLSEHFPTVMCSEYSITDKVSFVCINDSRAAQTAADYLASIGRKKIGLVNSSLQNNYAKHRQRGYEASLRANGLPLKQEWVVYVSKVDYHMAVSAITAMLLLEDRPDALFCVSDVFAAAAIKAAQNVGMKIPEDLAVVGFDNIDVSSMVVPALTTVKQPSYQLGQQACEELINMIDNNENQPKKIILDTEIIIREST